MQNLKNKIKNILCLLIVSILCSCASTNAPQRWLSSPEDMQTDVFGGWVELEYYPTFNSEAPHTGELIAINQDSIFIANDTFYALALSDIKSAQLVSYNSNWGAMSGLVLLGILSTGSNGYFSLLTAPVWLIVGSFATSARSYEPIIEYPKQGWDRFSQFARHPQGLPPKINRQKIKMKSGSE